MQSTIDSKKRNGIHYTPADLALFLSAQIWSVAASQSLPTIRILDPACGDGQLLAAMLQSVGKTVSVELVGYETDPLAASTAARELGSQADCQIHNQDFLESVISNDQQDDFDIVIANPPYVRTQNLPNQQVVKLRNEFGLSGRIDLYQAFCAAITRKLKIGGTLGLLTSNRFMYVQSGRAMRRKLSENYKLKKIFDLGDTRLFSAAVLPVIVIAQRTDQPSAPGNCEFTRVYRNKNDRVSTLENEKERVEVFNLVLGKQNQSPDPSFNIETGRLASTTTEQPWAIANEKSLSFLADVAKNQSFKFSDLAEVKVGIKTTADWVFIREHWAQLEHSPEPELLHPLITHHICKKWRLDEFEKTVLYPYRLEENRRAVDLAMFPQAKKYFQQHQERLKRRKYLENAGREWYEIWVPQQPKDWRDPKIVWPDISEQPRFLLDESGAVVNGDCYWLKLKKGVDRDWMYLMLAVANSSLAVEFYDCRFHNKLYSGRRRFMTQYVKEFPLPNLEKEESRELVDRVKTLTSGASINRKLEDDLDRLVRQSFQSS